MKTSLQIPAITSLPSTLTAKTSMKMTFSSDKNITIFLRRIQRLQIFKIPIDVIRTSKVSFHCFFVNKKADATLNPDRSNTETYGLARNASSQLEHMISTEAAWPHNKLCMLSCLSMCPIYFCCPFLMVFSILRVSPAISNTSSFVNLSVHLILNIRLLHIHISNASNLRDSSFLNIHVSLPYNVTLHTNVFTSLFLRDRLMFLLSNSRLLRNACLPMHAILVLTSFVLRLSLSNVCFG